MVEDSPDNAALLAHHLRDAGCEAVLARDGAEGLSAYWQAVHDGRPFRLAFIDIAMPHIDGLTMAQRVRAAEGATDSLPRAWLVAYTAYRREAKEMFPKESLAVFDEMLGKGDGEAARVPLLVAAARAAEVGR